MSLNSCPYLVGLAHLRRGASVSAWASPAFASLRVPFASRKGRTLLDAFQNQFVGAVAAY